MCPNLRENIRCGECWYAALLVILHTQYVKCVGNITYNMELWKYYTPNICEMCWKYYIQYGDMEILHTQYLWTALKIFNTIWRYGNVLLEILHTIWKYYIQYRWNMLETSHGFTGNVGAWVWKYKCGWELSLWKIVVLRILWGSIRILRSQLENTADGISSLDIVQLSLNMILLCLSVISG